MIKCAATGPIHHATGVVLWQTTNLGEQRAPEANFPCLLSAVRCLQDSKHTGLAARAPPRGAVLASSITAGSKVEGCEIRPAGLIDRSVGRVCASLSVTLCWSDVGTSDIGTAGPGRGVSLTMIESLRKVGAGVGGWGWSGVGARGLMVWGKDGFREPEVGGAAATTPR